MFFSPLETCISASRLKSWQSQKSSCRCVSRSWLLELSSRIFLDDCHSTEQIVAHLKKRRCATVAKPNFCILQPAGDVHFCVEVKVLIISKDFLSLYLSRVISFLLHFLKSSSYTFQENVFEGLLPRIYELNQHRRENHPEEKKHSKISLQRGHPLNNLQHLQLSTFRIELLWEFDRLIFTATRTKLLFIRTRLLKQPNSNLLVCRASHRRYRTLIF